MKARIYLAILTIVSYGHGLVAMKPATQESAIQLQPYQWQHANNTFKFKCVDSVSDEDIIEMPGYLVQYSKSLRTMINDFGNATSIIPLFNMTKEDLQHIIQPLEILVNPQKTYPDLITYFSSLNQSQFLKCILHLNFLDIRPLLLPAAHVLQQYLVQSPSDILTWQLGLPTDILTILKNLTLRTINTPLAICNLSVETLSESFSSTALNQDGTTFAIGMWDNTIDLVGANKQQIQLQGHTEPVSALKFSPDDQKIASASQKDNTVRIWNIATQQEIAQFKNHRQSHNFNMQFSSDNNCFACIGWNNPPEDNRSDESYALINRKNGQMHMLTGVKGVIYDIAISPDGKQAALVGEDIYMWNTETQKLTILPIGNIVKPITKAIFSPNGKLLACSSAETELKTTEIILWNMEDIAAKAPLLKIITRTIPTIIAFSQDSTLMAFDDEETVVVWNVQEDNPITRVDSHRKSVHSLDFTPDNKHLVSTSQDNILRILDIPNEQEKQFKGEMDIIDSAFVIDNTTVISVSTEGTLHTWDIITGQSKKLGNVPYINGIEVMSPDKKLIALSSTNGNINLFNIQTGEMRILSQGPHLLVDLEFNFDGQFLLAVYANGTTFLWDTKTGIAHKIVGTKDKIINKAYSIGDGTFVLVEEKTKNFINLYDMQKNITYTLTHDTDIHHLAFSPNGKQLIASAEDNAIIIWDVYTKVIIKQLNPYGNNFAVSPDGHTLVLYDEKQIYLVDLINNTQNTLTMDPNLKENDMLHMAFNSDGSLLALYNPNNKDAQDKIQIWDIATHTLKHAIHVPMNSISNYFFVPNTSILVITTSKNVLFWNTHTSQLLFKYDLKCSQNAVSMSKDGSKIIVSGTRENDEPETVMLTLDQTLVEGLNRLSFTQAFIIARALQSITKGAMLDLSNSPDLLAIFNQIDPVYRAILERCFQIKTK